MSAEIYPITIDKGSKFELLLLDSDLGGVAVDYSSGFRARFVIKEYLDSAEAVYDLSDYPDHITLSDGSGDNGENIALLIPGTTTAEFPALSAAQYELTIEPTGSPGDRETVARGPCVIRQNVVG